MHNPYAPPTAELRADEGPEATPQVELRRAHIQREHSVKALAGVMLLGAVGLGVGALAAGSFAVDKLQSADGGAGDAALGALMAGGLSAAFTTLALGLRRLRPWSRRPALIVAGLALLNFPMGTVFGGTLLYYLLPAEGRLLFSPEYAAAVAATPAMRPPTSRLAWVAAALFFLLFFALLVFIGA
jgi:hypothetical protein